MSATYMHAHLWSQELMSSVLLEHNLPHSLKQLLTNPGSIGPSTPAASSRDTPVSTIWMVGCRWEPPQPAFTHVLGELN